MAIQVGPPRTSNQSRALSGDPLRHWRILAFAIAHPVSTQAYRGKRIESGPFVVTRQASRVAGVIPRPEQYSRSLG